MFKRCKWIASLILVFMMLYSIPALAIPTVLLDGQQMSFLVPPIIENGRTLVPLRAIFEPLGATVQWDDPTQTIKATKGNVVITLKLGRATAYVDNQPVELSVPAKAIDGRTMVPLRFVGEALGAQVNWNGDTETITILSVPSAGTTTLSHIKVHFIDVGQTVGF